MLELLKAIKSCKQIDSDKLVDILESLKPIPEDFFGFNNFNHHPSLSYGRNKIYEGRNFSVFIMSWLKNDFTAIHSHGTSDWGAVYFFGDMDHKLYRLSANNLKLADKSKIRAGSIVPVAGELIHAMGNMSNSPVLTLHIYGTDQSATPANDDSSVFELEKRQVRITNGAAYINIADDLCRQTLPGVDTDAETLTDYLQTILPFYKRINAEDMVQNIDTLVGNPSLYFEKQLV
jgi:cysteine dioxygenase